MTNRKGVSPGIIPKDTPKNIITTKSGKKILVAGKVTKSEKEKLEGSEQGD